MPAKRTKGPGEEQHMGVEAPQAPAAGDGPTAMDEDEPAAHVSAAAARPAQEGSDVPSTSGAAERKPPFKPSDEHTVFVKHLDINVTKEDVEKLFAPVGGMKDVRMRMHEDGTSKVGSHLGTCCSSGVLVLLVCELQLAWQPSACLWLRPRLM